MDYKKFLENPNTQKYLKHYISRPDAVNQKIDNAKQLNEDLNQKKSRKIKKDVIESEEDTGYGIKDIINECPRTSEVRDFFKFQVENICDDDDVLFS